MSAHASVPRIPTDTILKQRERQIAFGKATEGYRRYAEAVPRAERRPYHPVTPRASMASSRRCFRSAVSAWRRALHDWDSVAAGAGDAQN